MGDSAVRDAPRPGEVVWFIQPDPTPPADPVGLLWNGVETLVLLGPTGTHLGGHTEKGPAYLRRKLEWVRSLGYVEVPPGWTPPKLTRRDRRLVEVLTEDISRQE